MLLPACTRPVRAGACVTLARRSTRHWKGSASKLARSGGGGHGPVGSQRAPATQFLFAVEDAGITTVGGITSGAVSDAVTAVAERRRGGLAGWLFAVRAFLRQSHDAGVTRSDLSVSVPGRAAPRRVVREGFAAEEIRTLLEATVGDSIMLKRDRAIMTLAAQTGLRAGDLARLERSDIDWRTSEIRLVQAKTGRPLCLPLGVDSGNAIADYLLNYRTQDDSPSLFVCCTGPIRPLGPRSISAVVTGYMRRCDLGRSRSPAWGAQLPAWPGNPSAGGRGVHRHAAAGPRPRTSTQLDPMCQ